MRNLDGGWIGIERIARVAGAAAMVFVLAHASRAEGPAAGAVVTNSAGMRLVYVPGGEFTMGSPASEAGRHDNEMEHRATLSAGFYLGATEVTQREWASVMGGYNPSKVKGPDLPVTGVKWDEAAQFCQKLSGTTGKTHRLPTEAEWERACRAGGAGAFSGGTAEEVAWHVGNSGDATHPVAKLKPNAWGLYDMHGNAMEWCSDWYQERLGRAAVSDPAGATEGDARVARGGSFRHYSRAARSAARAAVASSYQFDHLGFRVVMEAK